MVINILDKEVVENYKNNLQEQRDGINLYVLDNEDKKLYGGVVWPNEQYEYDADKGGVYKICLSLTDSMFMDGYSMIKVQVKFASEFHRDKNAVQKG